MTAKQLEQETGCKIMVRGKGSMRDKKKVSMIDNNKMINILFFLSFCVLMNIFFGFLLSDLVLHIKED